MDLFEISYYSSYGAVEYMPANEDDVVVELNACRELHYTADPVTVLTTSTGLLALITRL
jgi:hypothetical protein